MNLVGLDRIVFRFSAMEVAAMLKVMSLPGLPGLPLHEEPPGAATEETLVEDGIAMLCGDRTFVDGTVALILREAALSARCAWVRGAQGLTALYRGAQLYVLAVAVEGWIRLEPLPDAQAAREAFLRAAGDLGEALQLALYIGGEEVPVHAGGAAALMDQFETQ